MFPATVCRSCTEVNGYFTVQELILERDPAGLERLKFQSQGWKFWEWSGHKIHYVQAGEGCRGIGHTAIFPGLSRKVTPLDVPATTALS